MTVRPVVRKAIRVGGWMVGLVAVLWAMHRLGQGALSPPPFTDRTALRRWALDRDPVTIGFAMLRLVALGCAWYLVVVTFVGAGARLTRIPRLIALTDLATLPLVRRMLGGVFGLGLTAAAGTIIVAPLLSDGRDGRGSPARGVAVAMQRAEGTAVIMGRQRERPTDDDGTATMRVLEPGDVAAPAPHTRWTAAPGDSLWSLAESHLSTTLGRPVGDTELVPYWQEVVERNRTRLVDPTNADLIFPGQQFEIPALPRPADRPG